MPQTQSALQIRKFEPYPGLPGFTLSGMATITGNDIQNMVRHWLNTPVGGYLGSDYGQDVKSLLQRPHADGAANELLAKMRDDVPVLVALPGDSLNLYGVPSAPDRLDLVVEVAGQAISLTET